ncbi:MAG: nuclear transport factor 2 family protein [Pseudomonadales bacterium]
MTPRALSRSSQDYNNVKLLILDAIEIIRSDNFEDYFDLFADDAVWMMPSNARDVGLDEARSFYGFTKKFRFDQKVLIDELLVAGDWAYVRLTFDGYLRSKYDDSAPPLRSVSRHVWILRRQLDDTWKISRDIWNTPKHSV